MSEFSEEVENIAFDISEMESGEEALNIVNSIIELLISKGTSITEAPKLGLERRAGWEFWIPYQEDGIIIRKGRRGTLDYYGGFEYVDKENVHELGDYVFYSCEDIRVEECIEHWRNL